MTKEQMIKAIKARYEYEIEQVEKEIQSAKSGYEFYSKQYGEFGDLRDYLNWTTYKARQIGLEETKRVLIEAMNETLEEDE